MIGVLPVAALSARRRWARTSVTSSRFRFGSLLTWCRTTKVPWPPQHGRKNAPGLPSVIIASSKSEQVKWRRIPRQYSSGWRSRLSFKDFHRRRRAGAQHRQVARHCEKFHAALGKRHGAIGGMTIGARNFLCLLYCGDQPIKLAFDVLRQRIDRFAVRERDRQIRRAEKKAVNARRGNDRVEIL